MECSNTNIVHVDAPNFDPRCCENQQKKNFFLRNNFRPLPIKNVQFWDLFFAALFPKDSESLKTLDIRFREVGAKQALKIYMQKEDKQTNRQTDTQTHRLFDYQIESAHWADSMKVFNFFLSLSIVFIGFLHTKYTSLAFSCN